MNDNYFEKPKLLRVPKRLHSKDELLGLISKLEYDNILVIVEDDEGCWNIVMDNMTLERMNWMIDRAKLMVHGD